MSDSGNGNKETRWYGNLAQPRYIIGFVAAIAAVIAASVPIGLWLGDRQENWRYRQFEHYEALLSGMDGISCQPGSMKHLQAKEELSRRLKLCWLYCSDTVIEQGYAILGRFEKDSEFTSTERNRLLLGFMKTIRIEMFPDGTDLSADISDTLEICENE